MPSLVREALELLEYKVDDLMNRRNVRGGVAAVWDLFERLGRETGQLDETERKRLATLGRQLRSVAETPLALKKTASNFDDLVIGDAPSPTGRPNAPTLDGLSVIRTGEHAAFVQDPTGAGQPDVQSETDGTEGGGNPELAATARMELQYQAERAELHKLATSVWWFELDRFITQVAASLRAERDRYTARILYATHRNLVRYGSSQDYRQDANLSRFVIRDALPARDDALVSVDDLDSLAELVREILSTVMTLGEPGTNLAGIQVSREQSLEFVRQAALAVARDPYAGRLSLLRQREPDSGQLRLAIQELGKEWMREEERLSQRRELEQRLQAVLAFERHQKQLFARDVTTFVSLVHAFFDKIGRFLPVTVGGQASGPQLQGGVVGARNPLIRLDTVPDAATQVTVCAAHPVRFRLSGQDIGIRRSGDLMSLSVSGREVPAEASFGADTGRGRLHGFREGDYVHLRFEDFGRSLAALVAEALAAYYILMSERRDDLLTVLRILANSLVGEPQELIRQALARLQGLSTNVPRRRVAIEGFLRGSARAANVELPDSVVLALVQRFHTAMTVTPADLGSLLDRLPDGEASVYPLTGEPLTVRVGTNNLTVRQYRGRGDGAQESLVVMLPGRTLGSFTDYMIEPLGPGTLICVRGDDELAVIHFEEGTGPKPDSTHF